jgi:hypothetical protein
MRNSFGKTVRIVVLMACGLSLCAGAAAQSTETTVAVAKSSTTLEQQQLKGELMDVAHDSIVVRMIPDGDYRVFVTTPDRIVIVDGVEKRMDELKKYTVLTADVTVTQTSILERTTTELSGTVVMVTPKTVILTLKNGTNKQYEIKPEFKFTADGKPIAGTDLKKGMVVNAVKIVEKPVIEVKSDAVITGVEPD